MDFKTNPDLTNSDHELNQLVRHLQKSTDTIYLTLTENGTISFYTQGFASVLNIDGEHLFGKSIFDYVSSYDKNKIQRCFQYLLKGASDNFTINTYLVDLQGKEIYCSMKGAVSKNEDDIRIILQLLIVPDYSITCSFSNKIRNEEDRCIMLSNCECQIEKRLQMTIEAVDIAIWERNLKTNECLFTCNYADIFDHEMESGDLFLMHTQGQFVHPDDLPKLVAEFDKLRSFESDSFFCEFRCTSKDGEYLWFHTQGTRKSKGSCQILGITQLIQKRKNAEVELQENYNFLQSILESSSDRFIFYDANGEIKMFNSSYFSSLGYTQETYRQAYDRNQLYHPEDIDVITRTKKVGLGPKVRDVKYRLKDASDNWRTMQRRATKFYDNHGNFTGEFHITRDITQILQDEKRTQSLLKAIPDIMFIFNREGIFTDFSSGNVDLYREPVEFIGKSVFDILPPDIADKTMMHIQEALTGKLQIYEYSLPINCENQMFEARMVPVDNEEVVVIVRDITDKKRYEESLLNSKQRAEKNDVSKSAYLANMSHEIRTPMNAILGFTELLRDSDLDNDDRISFLDLIQKNGSFLLNLINDIIDFSKIESGQLKINIEKILVNTTLKQLEHTFLNQIELQEKKDVKLICDISNKNDNLILDTDELRFIQVLNNLLSNALKFTNSGHIKFGYRIVDDKIIFHVEDTGIGISQEKQEVIFERFEQAEEFTTRKFGGTGLGLPISRSLLNLLGGEIWVESKLGEGSKFLFSLPYNPGNVLEFDEDEFNFDTLSFLD